jgi:hypothetical protein
MKKIFLSLTTVFLLATSYAQVSFGAKGGLNLASITGKDIDSYNMKAGIHFGGFVEIPIQKSFSVRPELFYSSEGALWDGSDDGKTRLGYLQLPVLAKIKFAENFFAETGPQVGFLISAKDTYDGDTYSVKEHLKGTSFSWALGAGYQVTSNVGLYARYNFALSKFYHEEKSTVFQIGASYSFTELLKKK